MNKRIVIATAVIGFVIVGLTIWYTASGSGGSAVVEQRRSETILHQCSSCGSSREVTMQEMMDKGWMAIEPSEGPVGGGRKCPECGKTTMRFIRPGAAARLPEPGR